MKRCAIISSKNLAVFLAAWKLKVRAEVFEAVRLVRIMNGGVRIQKFTANN